MNLRKLTIIGIFAFLGGCSSGPDVNSPLVFSNDLEKALMWNESSNNAQTITRDPDAHSGRFVTKLDSIAQFGFLFKGKLGDINNKPMKSATASMWVKVKNLNANATLVLAIDSAGKLLKWQGTDIKGLVKKPNEWVEIKNSITIEDKLNKPGYTFGFYLWNKSKEEIMGDDMYLEFKD